jgi:hypothetical protein
MTAATIMLDKSPSHISHKEKKKEEWKGKETRT